MKKTDVSQGKRIAVVGAGVSGLVAAWLLQRRHQVTLFERNDDLGGHTRTLEVADGPDAGLPVDTGFIVMNHRNYPLLTELFRQLEVPLQDSDMSFSFSCGRTGYTYSGTGLKGLFARRSNLFRPAHWSMIRDLFRFNREARADLERGALRSISLSDYLDQGGYGRAFRDRYLLPMGGAIWSSPQREIGKFVAESYIAFFDHHGLLDLKDRPQWRTVTGGARTYVRAMMDAFQGEVRRASPVAAIRRTGEGVSLALQDGRSQAFDEVVIGAHADEALALLEDPSPEERELLGAWRYQENEALLHTSAQFMPPVADAWASWNFRRPKQDDADRPVSVTYHMNRLQNLDTGTPYFVTLNPDEAVPENRVLDRHVFTHPLFDGPSLDTQARLPELNGVRNTWFCGSYFGYGFHEDGARSGVHVARGLGVDL